MNIHDRNAITQILLDVWAERITVAVGVYRVESVHAAAQQRAKGIESGLAYVRRMRQMGKTEGGKQ
jgi:hypothetical protein